MEAILVQVIGWTHIGAIFVATAVSWPLLLDTLLTSVQLNELLKLVVCATHPVSLPVDELSLQNETHSEKHDGHNKVRPNLRSRILVDAGHKHPESDLVNHSDYHLILLGVKSGIFLYVELKLLLILGEDRRKEADTCHENEHNELCLPQPRSKTG